MSSPLAWGVATSTPLPNSAPESLLDVLDRRGVARRRRPPRPRRRRAACRRPCARRGERHRAEALAAEVEAVGEAEEADDLHLDHAARGRELDPVAHARSRSTPPSSPRPGSRGRPRCPGPRSAGESVRSSPRLARRPCSGSSPGVLGDCRSSSTSDRTEKMLPLASSTPSVPRARSERRGGQRAGRLDTRDDQVGLAVDRVVEVGEGALDRRRQQQDAADHPHAEHDPGRRQQQPAAGASAAGAAPARSRTSSAASTPAVDSRLSANRWSHSGRQEHQPRCEPPSTSPRDAAVAQEDDPLAAAAAARGRG